MISLVTNKQFLPDAFELLFGTEIKQCSVEEAYEYLEKLPHLEVDTETIKDWYNPDGHVFTLQLGHFDRQFVIDAVTVDINIFRPLLETKLCLFQNFNYDNKWFLHKYGIRINKVYDTFIAERILTTGLDRNRNRAGLDAIVWKYCRARLDKTIRGKINYLGLTKETVEYAAGDVQYLTKVMEKQKALIKQHELEKVEWLEMSVIKAFSEMEMHGVWIDDAEWLGIENEYRKELKVKTKVLDDYVLKSPASKFYKYSLQLDLFAGTVNEGSNRPIPINYTSPKQLQKLFMELEIPVPETATGGKTVNEKKIEKLKGDYEFIKLYLDFKKTSNMITKVGRKFLKKFRNPVTGRFHTNFKQLGTDTGRVASSEPNLQNIPKDTKHRNCIKPKQGNVFVGADFSSQELVLIAEDSEEKAWLEALDKGQDLHSVVAETVFGDAWKKAADKGCQFYEAHTDKDGNVFPENSKQKCDCKKHKSMRDKMKKVNYTVAYGAGPPKVAEELDISRQDAKRLLDQYFKGLPNLANRFKDLRAHAVAHLQMRTFKPFRRIRFFEPPMDEKQKSAIERQGGNARFQGTGADMMKLAIIHLWEEREKTGIPFTFVLQIHDELIVECDTVHAAVVLKMVEECMQRASRLFLKQLTIKTDGKITTRWEK